MNPFLAEKPLFRNKTFLHDTFFSQCVRCYASKTLLLEILGERMHGPPPTQMFWGPSLYFPLSLRPCVLYVAENFECICHVKCCTKKRILYIDAGECKRGTLLNNSLFQATSSSNICFSAIFCNSETMLTMNGCLTQRFIF